MSDYTPSEARVCIDFCNAAIKRPKPDGSVMTMEEADAAFTRFLAEKRAEWEAEHDGSDTELAQMRDQIEGARSAWWSATEQGDNGLVYTDRIEDAMDEIWTAIGRADWLPVPDTTNDESEGKA